jgi:hypothetical protein
MPPPMVSKIKLEVHKTYILSIFLSILINDITEIDLCKYEKWFETNNDCISMI